jgi:hypothetical protein
MKMRHKLILSLLVMLSGLLAGLPLLIGLILQREMPRAVAELDQQLGGFSIRLISIERHWFSSDLRLAVEPVNGSPKLIYHSHMTHGPWPLDQPSWLHGQGSLIHPDLAALVDDNWRLSPALNLSADIQSHWQQGHSGQRMDLNLHLRAARRLDNIRVDLLPSSVTLPGQFHSQALAGLVQFSKDNDENWQVELQLAAASLGDGHWPQLLSRPVLELTLEARQSKVSATTTITVHRIASGPDHNYRDATARISIEGLHRETLANWLDAVIAGHKRGLRGRYLIEMAGNTLLLALPSLLAHQPSIDLEHLKLVSPEGEANVRFEIGLVAAPPPGFLLNPGSLVEVAAANGALQLPQALAQHWAVLQARAELGPAASLAMVTAASNEFLLRLRANQLLISDGTNYRLALELSQGELTLNGQSMHLPTF